jgi:uncharacterized membrane protein
LRPILVFVSGSLAVATVPLLLLPLLGFISSDFHDVIVGQSYWKALMPIVGSWIGGSTSMLVLKEVVECPESLFLTVFVMDNVIVNVWTILMFQAIKRSDSINGVLKIKDEMVDFIPDEVDFKKDRQHVLATALLCVLAIVLAAFLIESFIAKVLILSLAGLLLGNFLPFWDHATGLKLGGVMIVLIMAILGLKLNFNDISLPVEIVIFVLIWLISHYVVMTFTAYLLKLNMAWVPIASMANVGGISTAPAVTKAYNEEWMPHAILLAILSMVSGTTWGLVTIFLFQHFFL